MTVYKSTHTFTGSVIKPIPALMRIESNKKCIEDRATLIANELEVPLHYLRKKTRRRKVVEPRQMLTWVLFYMGFPYEDITDFFGQERTTFYHSMEVVEYNPSLKREAVKVLVNLQRKEVYSGT